jgi:hypothetical protein
MTMPRERSRMEVRSSREMSSGRGVKAKVAVCSWVEYTLEDISREMNE